MGKWRNFIVNDIYRRNENAASFTKVRQRNNITHNSLERSRTQKSINSTALQLFVLDFIRKYWIFIMYFVVYFVKAKKHLVIPKHWVFEHETALEKFINYSLNSNQSHMCYFANDVDQTSLLWHTPDFEAPFVDEFPFHGKEGRSVGQMKRYFSKYSFENLPKKTFLIIQKKLD